MGRFAWFVLLCLSACAGCNHASVTARAAADRAAPRGGHFELKVISKSRFGVGAADYTLLRDGQTAWSGERPFTLSKWAIGDDGSVFGTSYTQPLEGRIEGGPESLIQIWGLDPNGSSKLLDSVKREPAFVTDVPDYPIVEALVLVPAADLGVVDIVDFASKDDPLWTYHLSSGEKAGRIKLSAAASVGMLLDLKAVPGEPYLMLASSKASKGSPLQIAVVDMEGNVKWSHSYPLAEQPPISTDLNPGILDPQGPGAVGVVLGKERIALQISDAGVKEVGRASYDPMAATRAEIASIPLLKEAPSQTVVLSMNSGSGGPIKEVRNFILAGPGRLAYVEGYPEPGPLVIVDKSGRLLGKAELKGLKEVTAYVWARGMTFLVAEKTDEAGEETRLWWVDLATGKRLQAQNVPPKLQGVTGLARFTNGNLAVFAGSKYVSAVTPDLKPIWTLEAKEDDSPSDMGFPQGIGITHDDRLVVVDNIRSVAQFYDRSAKHLFQVDLTKTLKRHPNYVTGAAPDVNGGILILDFRSEANGPTVYRLTKEGKFRDALTPKYPDGRIVDSLQSAAGDEQGNFWSCDQHALVRLDPKGTVVQVLGSAPRSESLGEIAALEPGPHGEFIVRDDRTDGLHAFDRAGKGTWSWKPDPKMFQPGMFKDLATDPDGTIALSGGKTGDVVVSRETGQAVAWTVPKKQWDTNQFATRLASKGLRWSAQMAGYLRLVDEHGVIKLEIRKRADGAWFGAVTGLDGASDGSVAVMDETVGEGEDMGPAFVSVFRQDGTPVSCFELPGWVGEFAFLEYDGRRIALQTATAGVVCFDLHGKPLWRMPEPVSARKDRRADADLIDGTDELAVFDQKNTVRIYKLPAVD